MGADRATLFPPSSAHACMSESMAASLTERPPASFRRWNVQNCDLVALTDLDTASPAVQGRIATYISRLAGMGVAGARIDAAKHIPADDISAILQKAELPQKFFVYQVGGKSWAWLLFPSEREYNCCEGFSAPLSDKTRVMHTIPHVLTEFASSHSNASFSLRLFLSLLLSFLFFILAHLCGAACQEVIRGVGEPILPSEYLQSGRVLEFGYPTEIYNHFTRDGELQYLKVIANLKMETPTAHSQSPCTRGSKETIPPRKAGFLFVTGIRSSAVEESSYCAICAVEGFLWFRV